MLCAMKTILGAACLVLALAGCGDTSEIEQQVDAKIEREDAERVCKGFVKERLKSPGSAEFETTATGKAGSYTVVGTVDSENGFGALIRNDFTCSVKLDGDTWHLKDLSGLAN